MSTTRPTRADSPVAAAGSESAVSTPPDTVVYAIGDIHGRCDLLETLQQGISADARERSARRKVVVYLGDYLSRGIDSSRVVEMVRNWRPDGCDGAEIVPLKGNHEDMALRFLDGDLEIGRFWFSFDSFDALSHYGVESAAERARDEETMDIMRRRFALALPAEHLKFLRGLKAGHREGGYLFVHAGIRPGVALEAQSDYDRMWHNGPFLESEENHGATVVHGHTIASTPQIHHNRIGIDTGAYASGILTCLILDGGEVSFLHT